MFLTFRHHLTCGFDTSMHVLKKYPKFLKYSCLASISCGVGWLYYQIKTTENILANALDTTILNIAEPTVVEKQEDEKFLFIKLPANNRQPSPLVGRWNMLKFYLAKRFLVLASSDNVHVRKKAIRQLARIKKLDDWQYSQLATLIDAKTAVGLARTPGVDHRLFGNTPSMYPSHSHEMIVDVMRDLLLNLHDVSQHPCVGFFISKAFFDVDDFEKYVEEFSSFELKKFIQSRIELLPTCLETLLHHASVGNYAKDIAALNGLPLLMEIHNRFKENLNVSATICRIISYLSMHGELLEKFHATGTYVIRGWITILSQWVKHDDVRISIPAAKALANLDSDEKTVYLQRLYPLHPSTRCVKKPGVDVVFVHGLLGGVFFTWRQRRASHTLGFLGKRGPSESLTHTDNICENKLAKTDKELKSSDPEMQEYFEELSHHLDCEGVCKNYDVVWEDIPTKTNEAALGPYCTSARSFVDMANGTDACYTNCWPRDWLAEDCDHLRIIGVNYETNLSLWTPICPVEQYTTLKDRGDELIQQLIKVGVGDRPIVWVTHSMGGLIVKCLLNEAAESESDEIKNMYLNTRGIVFYSTPHVGSSVAKFNPASALVIWPSVEVQELQKNSPLLKEIHQNFLNIVQEHPMKIVTFIETEPTVVSAMKLKFLVVEPDSGNPGCGEYYEIPLDHLGICKPASRYSFLYQKVLSMIKDILAEESRKM